MPKITLTDLTNLQNETSATTVINNNNATVEGAFDNTLSRDGSLPNSMAADLDMDSNRILNLPAAVSDTEPVRKAELDALEAITASAALIDAVASATSAAATASSGASTATTQASVALAAAASLEDALDELGTMSVQDASAVNITGGAITGMSSLSGNSDVATKGYVDGVATGIHTHLPMDYATVAVLSNTPTYDNGASGVGATLTAGSNGALSVDGTAVDNGERILVKDQASGLQNGI